MKFTLFPKKKILLLLGDTGIIVCAYFLSLFLRFGAVREGAASILWPILIAYLFTFYLLDSYDTDLKFRHVQYLFRHMLGVAGVGAGLAIYFFFFPGMKSGRGVFLISVLLAGVGTYLWRVVFFLLFRKRSMKRSNLVIIGSGNAMETLYQIMKDSPEYRVLGVIPDDSSHLWRSPEIPRISGDPKNLRHISRTLRVNVLVLAMSHFRDPELLKAALDCKLDGVAVFDMPSFYENVTGKVPVEHVTDFWLVFAPLLGVKKNVYNTKLKRSFDIALAFLGLVLALPPALLIAAVVALDSRGPILYQQRRVGLNDNVFTLLKFRSMKLDMDNDREHAGKKNDPRITRAGKVLRLFRLDELPQLWNVLKGDMSFIGPRALIEEEVQEFESKIPYFSLRHSIRPGISGWAQINYRHGAKVEDGLEKLQYDLFYIKNLSPLLDFIILMRTIKVVLSGRGAR